MMRLPTEAGITSLAKCQGNIREEATATESTTADMKEAAN
jgi:hypothetical protein